MANLRFHDFMNINDSELVVESMTQSPETLQKILEADGLEVEARTVSEPPAAPAEGAAPPADETSSSVSAEDAGSDAGAEEDETGSPEGETGGESETPQQQTQEQKSKSGSARLKKKLHEKDAELGEMRSQLETMQRQLAELTAGKPKLVETKTEEVKTTTVTPDPEPQLEDYDSYEEWNKDWIRWDRKQDEAARTETAAPVEKPAETKPAEPTAEQQAIEERWNSQLAEARKDPSMPDFDKVAFSDQIVVSGPMVAVARKLEQGAGRLIYWLGQHPEESKRIAEATQLPEKPTQDQIFEAVYRARREFDDILVKLSSDATVTPGSRETPKAAAPAAARPTSPQSFPPVKKATPVTPVGGRHTKTRSLNEMSREEVAALSNEEFRRLTDG